MVLLPLFLLEIFDVIYRGEREIIRGLVEKALEEHDPLEIINGSMTLAIKSVGDRFSTGELFLPDLILASETMQEAMDILTPRLEGNKDFRTYAEAHPDKNGENDGGDHRPQGWCGGKVRVVPYE